MIYIFIERNCYNIVIQKEEQPNMTDVEKISKAAIQRMEIAGKNGDVINLFEYRAQLMICFEKL